MSKLSHSQLPGFFVEREEASPTPLNSPVSGEDVSPGPSKQQRQPGLPPPATAGHEGSWLPNVSAAGFEHGIRLFTEPDLVETAERQRWHAETQEALRRRGATPEQEAYYSALTCAYGWAHAHSLPPRGRLVDWTRLVGRGWPVGRLGRGKGEAPLRAPARGGGPGAQTALLPPSSHAGGWPGQGSDAPWSVGSGLVAAGDAAASPAARPSRSSPVSPEVGSPRPLYEDSAREHDQDTTEMSAELDSLDSNPQGKPGLGQ